MRERIVKIEAWDSAANRQVDLLLEQVGIRRDGNLDYTCGLFDEADELVATGSCFGNTLRCLAVSGEHQGEGLLNQIMSHLLEVQMLRGNSHIFLYTKVKSRRFMESLGFYEIATVGSELVFMENRRNGFRGFCEKLAARRLEGQRIAGIVMNANPFTLGHRHLVETAARENDAVHLFVLSENAGPIPAAVRKRLVREGIADLPNVIHHETGPYMISSATFPSYFLKDQDTVIRVQAQLDIQVFCKIAQVLGITHRYVGEETKSHVTAMYHDVMKALLPQQGITCVEIPRATRNSRVISASTVRQAIHDGNWAALRDLVPETTYHYFTSPEGAAVCRRIQAETNVIHY